MLSIFANISRNNTRITLEKHTPTDKQLLIIETPEGKIELLLTYDQLKDLRETIKYTEEELEDMSRDQRPIP